MRVVLAVGVPVDGRFAAQARRHGHEVVGRAGSAADLDGLIAEERPDAAVVASSPRYLTSRSVALADDHGVRLVVLVGDELERRHAASLGLHETVDAAADWPTIDPLLRGPRPTLELRAPRERRGEVIAVWGPAGSPGRTTIAIGIAAELAAMGHDVALADVDTHAAAVGPTLGLLDESPGFAAACRLAGAGALDRVELERVGQRHESPAGSFWVLTGIARADRWPELSGERVSRVIRECRAWVDYTVLDTAASLESDEELVSDLFAPRRNAAAVTALHEADRLVAVGSGDPVGMSRFLRAYPDAIDLSGTAGATVVMNRVRASAIGMNPGDQVRRTLSRLGGVEAPLLIPEDRTAVDGAVLSGRTLAESAPRSPARQALRDLARTLAPDTVRRGGRRRR
jgi:MinD-like ATPase involved in chromosome partitioning or flagellar assembly